MTSLCLNCGAEFAVGIQAACRDCRLTTDVAGEPSLPDLEDGPDEMLFDLSLWLPEERVALGLTLDERGIPWRWEPGPELVVREADEAVVEELLDEEESGEGDWEELSAEEMDDLEADMEADLEADLEIDSDSDEDDDEDDEEDDGGEDDLDDEGDDGGDDAAAAMGDLFDAADRLMHNAANVEALVDVDRVATLVSESKPPYGVERTTWQQVGTMADAVLAASDEEDEAAVAETAKSLRDFLRTYV